jgi:hypothetical protein
MNEARYLRAASRATGLSRATAAFPAASKNQNRPVYAAACGASRALHVN